MKQRGAIDKVMIDTYLNVLAGFMFACRMHSKSLVFVVIITFFLYFCSFH